MSIHKECGETIQWFPREDDTEKFMPPMEYAGTYHVIGPAGFLVQTVAYRYHMCVPEKIDAWREYQEKYFAAIQKPQALQEQVKASEYIADDSVPVSIWKIARAKHNDESWEIAMTVPCRRCEAPELSRCINQAPALLKRGITQNTKAPHKERLADAYKQDSSLNI